MIWADWVIAVVLIVGVPIGGILARRSLERRVASGRPDARLSRYAWIIAQQWAMTLILLAFWTAARRPLDSLGLVWPSGAGVWWTLVIVVGGVGFFAVQVASVHRSAAARATVRAQLDSRPAVRLISPTTRRELRTFTALAATAGFCEEVLFRGYLFWFLSTLLPSAAAILAAIAAFGVGHVYQGMRDVFLTAAVGAIALGLYLLTGSLAAPIAVHATVDQANGFIVYRAFRDESNADRGQASE
jgi:membrane protease YdiL (CAAX protease family)